MSSSDSFQTEPWPLNIQNTVIIIQNEIKLLILFFITFNKLVEHVELRDYQQEPI